MASMDTDGSSQAKFATHESTTWRVTHIHSTLVQVRMCRTVALRFWKYTGPGQGQGTAFLKTILSFDKADMDHAQK